jgi:hypothetical protein
MVRGSWFMVHRNQQLTINNQQLTINYQQSTPLKINFTYTNLLMSYEFKIETYTISKKDCDTWILEIMISSRFHNPKSKIQNGITSSLTLVHFSLEMTGSEEYC